MHGIRLILARTMKSGNVGSCARLASNFSIGDCVLAQPEGADPAAAEALKYATKSAHGVLRSFRVTPTLFEAVADCHMAVGFTRRNGTKRRPTITLEKLAQIESGARVALVFGNERSGLSTEELSYCTHTCQIPAGELNPSLNLSHAVAVVASRIFENRLSRSEASESNSRRADLREFEDLMKHWNRFLIANGFVGTQNPERIVRKLRKVFGRTDLSKSEVALFHGLLNYSTPR